MAPELGQGGLGWRPLPPAGADAGRHAIAARQRSLKGAQAHQGVAATMAPKPSKPVKRKAATKPGGRRAPPGKAGKPAGRPGARGAGKEGLGGLSAEEVARAVEHWLRDYEEARLAGDVEPAFPGASP